MSLKTEYKKNIVPRLQKRLNTDNINAVPTVKKVVVNAGVGKFKDNKGIVDSYIRDLSLITGQTPGRTKARQSISNFKLRAGDVIGVRVTLRGEVMWDFLNKLVNVALPRVRDFKGVSSVSFDNSGIYSLGITDHTIFPEIDVNKVDVIKGFQVTIVTSAEDRDTAYHLLKELGMPFKES